MKLVAQLISVTFFSVYLIYIRKKERERKRLTNSQQEIKYDGHLGGAPFLSEDNCLSEGTEHCHL